MRRLLSWTIKTALAVCGILVAVFAIGVNWPQRDIRPARNAGVWAIDHVDVVDVERGQLLRDQSVVWSGGTITGMGPAKDVDVPADARRIDGSGRTLVPALWDMHTHLYAFSPLLDMPLYVAHGVTHVRDLQGCPSADDPFIACAGDKRRWSREALAGERVGPVIIESSSFMANGPGMAKRLGNVPDYFDTRTPEQARAFVRHFAGTVDTIKAYDRIPAPAWRARSSRGCKGATSTPSPCTRRRSARRASTISSRSRPWRSRWRRGTTPRAAPTAWPPPC